MTKTSIATNGKKANSTSALKRVATYCGITLAAVYFALALPAHADLTQKPEKLIQWRQSVYKSIEWNVARIKAVLEGPYNKVEVQTAANAIAALANSGIPSLFPAGSEEGKGWHDTNAKPELFKDKVRFTELSNNFAKEASELAKLAGTAQDATGVKDQFVKLTRTCKACHDDFKGKD